MLDALVGPDTAGRYRLEQNGDLVQNPRAYTFQSVHHLFCNMTEVPLDVLVCLRGLNYEVGTGIYPPGPLHIYDVVRAHPIRF